MRHAYIYDAIRTPIGNFGGTLSTIRTDDLAAHVIAALIKKNPSVVSDLEDVILGCANQAGEDNRNVARMAGLLAGLPVEVGGETVNRLCASGASAVINVSRAIQLGEGELFIAGGVEHMTRGPWVMSKVSKAFGRDASLHDSSFGWRFVNPKMKALYGVDGMGQTAENLVDKYGISRNEQDQFAYWSQQKAAKAQESGRLAEEIVSVSIPQRKSEPILFDKDEFVKPDTTVEKLATLRTAFRKDIGSVTAGNASGLNDGAGVLLMGSQEMGIKYDMRPMTRIVSSAIVGVPPRIMGVGPVEASNKALKRAGLTMDDMDIIELNEAFAVQVLSCLKEWDVSYNDPRVNPNGGAIALGHPLGMTGARLVQTASIELVRTQKRYALVTMCIGVGQGYALILERV